MCMLAHTLTRCRNVDTVNDIFALMLYGHLHSLSAPSLSSVNKLYILFFEKTEVRLLRRILDCFGRKWNGKNLFTKRKEKRKGEKCEWTFTRSGQKFQKTSVSNDFGFRNHRSNNNRRNEKKVATEIWWATNDSVKCVWLWYGRWVDLKCFLVTHIFSLLLSA